MLGSTETWPRDALPRGSVLHGYAVEAILGRGGFGITYRARDKIDQDFAIKECFPKQFAVRHGLDVLPTDAGDAEALADCLDRFMREAKALTRLSQLGAAGDGVVKVATFFEANGTAYIVMEHLAGQSLEALIKANRAGIAAEHLTDMLHRLLHALGCVHDAGLLHRDIKPGNIFLRADGRPVLIDFGATRTKVASNTVTFTQIYSESYAPIEQFAGGVQGPFSDLYALGMTCYRAIGGSAVDAFTRQQAALRGQADPLPTAARIGAGRYPPALLAALDAALAVAPAHRPQSVGEMLALLGGNERPTTIAPAPGADQAEPPTRLDPHGPGRWSRPAAAPSRRGRVVAVAALGLLAVLAIGAVLVWQLGGMGHKQGVTIALAPAPVAPATLAPPGGPAPPAAAGREFRDCSDCPELVVIPSGAFTMGSTPAETAREGVPDRFAAWEKPPHAVAVAGFALGKFAVTFAEWDACVQGGGCGGYRPDDRGWGRGDRPVINVSWSDAQRYIDWLNTRLGRADPAAPGRYRLPSEAEWEYAARAGTMTARPWGEAIGNGNANCGGCGSQWDSVPTSPVGSFPANAWGFYDMLGNAWQWTADCRNDSYAGAPADGSARADGDCASRVVRGGSWNNLPRFVRAATRDFYAADFRVANTGFRVARAVP